MLVDKTDGYLNDVKEFAARVDKEDNLNEQLEYLGNYSGEGTRCLLFKDFAPWSFAFSMQLKDKDTGEYRNWFNGGLIFHGAIDGYGSGAAPTLSVTLTPTDGWCVHT